MSGLRAPGIQLTGAAQPESITLVLYPALARAVLERSEVPQLLVWTAAKQAAKAGEFGSLGHRDGIPFESFVRQVAATVGRSCSTVRKTVATGEGLFWDIEQMGSRRVFLPGPDLLAQRLGLEHAGRRVRRIAVTGRMGVARWRALLLATLLPTRPERLARETVARRSSVSARTQRRWEREGVAAHDDGHGRPPVRSAPVYGDFRLTLPTHPEGGPASPRAALQEVGRDGRCLGSVGFFVDERGARLLRQGPKEFAFRAPNVRRKPRVHRHGGPDTPALRPGNWETNPAVPSISWRPKPKRGSKISMQGTERIREGVPLGPNVSILNIKFGRPS